MNKRRKKKADSKISWPVTDEAGLIAMTQEERDAAYEEYRKFAGRHCRFFHYRDISRMSLYRYVYPVKGVCTDPTTLVYFFQEERGGMMHCVQRMDNAAVAAMNAIGETSGIKIRYIDPETEYTRLENAELPQ